ncbi:MAG: ExeM/NucH family extracellular endonuclease, partial [Pseudomonadota bacterium]
VQEEDADQDGDASTSEGIFVFEGSLVGEVNVNVGDLVTVTGIVGEAFGQTQISASSVEVIESGVDLPSATVVDLGATGAIEDDDSGVDYVVNLEAFEGMRVTFPEDLTISEMFNLDRFGEYRLSSEGRPFQFTQLNDPDVEGFDAHLQDVAARSIVLDDGLTAQNPFEIEVIDGNDGILGPEDSVRMGDTIANVTGVLRYGFDEYRIDDATGDYSSTNPRPESPEDVGGDFKVASLNVLNFFTTLDTTPGGFNGPNNSGPDDDIEPRGANSPEELERQATKLVEAIVEMDADVLGLVELENDDDEAIADVVARVNERLGAEVYDFIPTGDTGTDAITTGIIYKIETAIPTGDAAVLIDFNGESFVDPLGAGSQQNRPAVAQTFEDASSGELVTVAVNHLKSKGSSTGAAGDENIGDGAGASNGTRTEGARILADWLAADPTGTGAENQLILGDLNAYAEEDPLDVLAAAGFVDVAAELIGEEAYSFVFDGQIGTLDYILANGPAFEALTGVTEWHINADEADAIDYNIEITTLSDGTVVTRDPAIFDGDTAARNSDHDPVIAGFSFESGELLEIVGTPNRDRLFGTDADEKFIGLGGPDVMTGRGGDDVFVATRSVTIADFGNGDDRIDLSEAGVASFDQLVFVQNGSRTTVIDTESGLRFGVVG